jgi:hypothetical protein
MKLTKGKISKLYNKKKQTMKKKANKRKSSKKNRTFRRKQKVNLARKSLKRLRYKKLSGGRGVVPKSDEELGIFPPDARAEETVTVPLEETSTLKPPLNEELNVMPPGDADVMPPEITTDVLTGEADVVPPGDADVMPTEITTDVMPTEITTDVVPTQITTDVVPTDITTDEVPVAEEITTDEVPLTDEITTVEVPLAEEITTDEVSPEQIDVNEKEYQENVEPTYADLLAQENAAQEYIENRQPSIETKFTDLVNEIASKTAKKIEEKLTGEEVAQQNPAEALLSVANTFGSDTPVGGGYTPNTPTTGLAFYASPISDIRTAQPHNWVGGKTKRHRKHKKHSKSHKRMHNPK